MRGGCGRCPCDRVPAMLDVCFDPSVKALLTMAQQAADSHPEDIVCLPLGLSEGDIRSPILAGDCPRRRCLQAMLSCRQPAQEDGDAVLDALWADCARALQRLEAAPPSLRVWVDTPDSRCGLLFLADLLQGQDVEVRVVELPQRVLWNGRCAVKYRRWSEVAPEQFRAFMAEERVLAGGALQDLAGRWQFLRQENAPLRVVRDGVVVSAAIHYYDDLIRDEFPQGTCKVMDLVGRVLAIHQLPLDDAFLIRRIAHFIQSGELVLLHETERGFYDATVACGSGK